MARKNDDGFGNIGIPGLGDGNGGGDLFGDLMGPSNNGKKTKIFRRGNKRFIEDPRFPGSGKLVRVKGRNNKPILRGRKGGFDDDMELDLFGFSQEKPRAKVGFGGGGFEMGDIGVPTVEGRGGIDLLGTSGQGEQPFNRSSPTGRVPKSQRGFSKRRVQERPVKFEETLGGRAVQKIRERFAKKDEEDEEATTRKQKFKSRQVNLGRSLVRIEPV